MAEVAFERFGGVLVCTFDRSPVINASTPAMIGDWLAALDQAAGDASVRVVVTAANGAAWCAGADLRFLLHHQRAAERPDRRRLDALGRELIGGPAPDPARPHPALLDFAEFGLNAMAAYLRAYPKPLIAAIDGAVAGGGFPLALLHDVRLVSAAASFRTSFVDLGLVSELGLGYLLPRLVGPGVALDLFLSGRAVRGVELVQLGIAERWVGQGSARVAGIEYAQELASRPVEAVAAVRQLLRAAQDIPWREYLGREWGIQRDAFDSPGARQRVQAVAERLGLDSA